MTGSMVPSNKSRHFPLVLQVLTALAAAQGLGFRHWDLRLKNVMEHKGDTLCQCTACLQTCGWTVAD